MPRILTVFALGFLTAAMTASGRGQDKAAQLADLNLYGDFLSAEGVWRADNLNEKNELNFDVVTRCKSYRCGIFHRCSSHLHMDTNYH